ncbi:hypothetical protein [Nocardiopsis kunsanensis]|uniref:hypothetical protein n=1 Tax=Nocardiopsis kunsanensis TaxID=141693 RepID=UPI0003450029|nr:hypothetical protein [Nocardiopsis kunsanensis]
MDVETAPPDPIRGAAVRRTFPKRDESAPDGADLRVDAGRVCALRETNGDGATTLVRVLATLRGKGPGAVGANGWNVDHGPRSDRTPRGLALVTAAELLLGRPIVLTAAFVPLAIRAYRRLS